MTPSSPKGFFRARGFIPLGLCVGVALVYFSFFFDTRLEHLMEGYFSRINGAPVAIGSLNTNFFRGEITLKNIEAWIPDEDSHSLKVGEIKIRFNHLAVLARKLLIDDMSIEQIGLGPASSELTLEALQNINTNNSLGLIERVANGFQNDLKKQMGENPFRRVGLLLSGLDLSVEVQKKAKHLKALAKLDDYDTELSELDTDLKALVEALPPIDTFVPASLRAGGNSADTKISAAEIENLNKAQTALQDHWVKVEGRYKKSLAEFKRMRDVVDLDIAGFTQQLNLPRFDGNDLTPALAANTLASMLSRLNYWVDYSRRKMQKPARLNDVMLSGGDAHSGVVVHYAAENAIPTFWLKKARIQSTSTKNPKDGEVSGEITDITSDPAIVGRPLKAKVSAEFPAMKWKGLVVEGEVDHRQTVNHEWIKVRAAQIPVSKLAVNDAGDLGFWIKSGNMSFDFYTEFTDDILKSDLTALFDNVEFACSSRYKRIEETILGALNDLPKFNLSAHIEGPFDHVKMVSQSEVGKRLGEALAKEFRHQIGAIEDDLRKNILDVIFPRHQKQLLQLSAIKGKWLPPVTDRLNLAQALQRRAEKLIARSKPRRVIAAEANGTVKKSSQSSAPATRSN